MEQPRPRRRDLALIAIVLALAAAGGLLLRPARGHDAPALAPAPKPAGKVQIEVLNGTLRQGAARTATRMLRRQGLDVVFLGNADSLVDSTRIILRRGSADRAGYVATALGTGRVVVEIDTFRRVDVSVILGEDFRPRLPLHP